MDYELHYLVIYDVLCHHRIKTSKQSKEFYEFNKKIESKKIEKYGILIALILINTAVGILLYVMNYFTTPKENSIQGFFSLILIMTVVIFSAIVILLNSKLNKTLQNRTIQLEETSKELIKSERFSAIGELASRISHDIRNPLSNILMSIELIRNSPSETNIEDKNIVEKFDLISKNIERISHQINDVIEIWADPFQIQIACNNLIINAIQAIGKEKGEIRIRFLEDIENTIIEIENSGPRIPEEILPHIFDSLVTTKQVGTGLGLVSCKTIIENHGGTIQVKNNPTTFTIKLPKKH